MGIPFIHYQILNYTITMSNFNMFAFLCIFSLFSNFYQGYIQDAYIVSGPNGYLKQCPTLATQCPTCGQFSLLEKTIDDLIKNLDELKQRVSTN